MIKRCLLPIISLLLLTPLSARANQITPAFTQGSMQATTTTTQTVTETIATEVMGGDYSHWSGNNISASSHVNDSAVNFTLTTAGEEFQLETVSRVAGVVETIDITRNITTNSTTTSLSVFSQ